MTMCGRGKYQLLMFFQISRKLLICSDYCNTRIIKIGRFFSAERYHLVGPPPSTFLISSFLASKTECLSEYFFISNEILKSVEPIRHSKIIDNSG